LNAQTLDPRRIAGDLILTSLTHVGRLSMMVIESGRALVEWRIWFPRAMTEAYNIGIGSLFIVIVVSAFTGAVTAFQASYQFQASLPIYIVGTLIVESVILELGPVLTGLILAGRVGARWAAELGTMRVTEQIDALEVMATDPVHYLVVPRVWASTIMLPLLVVLGNGVGIFGGYLVAVIMMGVNPAAYQDRSFQFMELNDLFSGLIKAAVFGFLIASIGCQQGFYASGGAEGVGKATTAAVVVASIAILVSDFFLTRLLF
jgi:phospholipid/cholesterol/gamma-HCH transport system permease protein